MNSPEFLNATNDGFLLATIALCRTGTPMRAFGRASDDQSALSGDEIPKTVTFIRSWQK